MAGFGGHPGLRRWTQRTSDHSHGVWPAFVDALSALLTIILFALLVFVVAYLSLASSLTMKDRDAKALAREKTRLQQAVAQATLAKQLSQQEIDELRQIIQALRGTQALERQAQAQARSELEQKARQTVQQQEIELKALRDQLAMLLSERAAEAKAAKSEFFGQLKRALEGRKDVRVVGDRFIMQSEVLFDSGAADLSNRGQQEVKSLAAALIEVMASIPGDVAWVLRVDGHTDKVALRPGGRFRSNLDLSLARAQSVAALLIASGLPPERIAVAGFGEFRPLIPGQSSARDRRIELIFDQGY